MVGSGSPETASSSASRIEPPPSGPPPDVAAGYLQLVGLAPTAPSR